jgi:hypothetical protein
LLLKGEVSMTAFHISCPQYTKNEDGTTKEVGVYFEALLYTRPTSIEVAMADFVKTHAQSEYAKVGWELVGIPSFMIIKPELYKSYEEYIDEGVTKVEKPMQVRPANDRFKVIK